LNRVIKKIKSYQVQEQNQDQKSKSVFMDKNALNANKNEIKISGSNHVRTIPSSVTGNWIDYRDTTFSISTDADHDGTSYDRAMLIRNASQLAQVAYLVNNSISDEISSDRFLYRDKYYKLEADIDLGAHEWTPIGQPVSQQVSAYFFGNFNGNHHVISNLYIDSNDDNIGLFAKIDGTYHEEEETQVYNLGIESGDITGNNYVGGIAGYCLRATIFNCYNKANVTALTTDVSDVHGGVGGIAGQNESQQNDNSRIINCYNTGNITGVRRVGGIVGRNHGEAERNQKAQVINCYNTGLITQSSSTANSNQASLGYETEFANYFSDTIGGIVGLNYAQGRFGPAEIIGCYNTGKINILDDKSACGAIVGLNSSVGIYARVTYCYYNSETVGNNITGIGIEQFGGHWYPYENQPFDLARGVDSSGVAVGLLTEEMTGDSALDNMQNINILGSFTGPINNNNQYAYYPELIVFQVSDNSVIRNDSLLSVRIASAGTPVFNQEPEDITKELGEEIILTAEAQLPNETRNHNTEAISYQWQVLYGNEWHDIANATSMTYELPKDQAGEFFYRCVASVATETMNDMTNWFANGILNQVANSRIAKIIINSSPIPTSTPENDTQIPNQNTIHEHKEKKIQVNFL